MAYYISFLKTLSFRLNKHTIHFFYNEVRILLYWDWEWEAWHGAAWRGAARRMAPFIH